MLSCGIWFGIELGNGELLKIINRWIDIPLQEHIVPRKHAKG